MAGRLRFAGSVRLVLGVMQYESYKSARRISEESGIPMTTTRKVLKHMMGFENIRKVVTVRMGPVKGTYYWKLKRGRG